MILRNVRQCSMLLIRQQQTMKWSRVHELGSENYLGWTFGWLMEQLQSNYSHHQYPNWPSNMEHQHYFPMIQYNIHCTPSSCSTNSKSLRLRKLFQLSYWALLALTGLSCIYWLLDEVTYFMLHTLQLIGLLSQPKMVNDLFLKWSILPEPPNRRFCTLPLEKCMKILLETH